MIMKTLYAVTAIMLCASNIQSAQLGYQFPAATGLNDTDQITVYQGKTVRSITGAKLKSEITTAPIIRAPYGNYSSITFSRYSSTGVGLGSRHAQYTHQSFMYFQGIKLVISPVSP